MGSLFFFTVVICSQLASSLGIPRTTRENDFANIAKMRRVVDVHRDFQTLSGLALAIHSFDRAYHPAGAFKTEAIDAYEAALRFDEYSVSALMVRVNLMQLYEEQGRVSDAVRIVQDTLEEPRLEPFVTIADRRGLLLGLGKLKRSMGDSEWMRVMGKGFALQDDEDLSPHEAYLLTGLNEEEFDRVRPEGAKRWREHVDSIKESIARDIEGGKRDQFAAMKFFAVFNVEDKLARRSRREEDKARAWKWLEEGNTMMDALVEDDLQNQLDNLERIAAVFSNLDVTATNDPGGRKLIFIVGLPRSGSTLVEQILQSHSQVSGLGEDTEFNAGLSAFRERLVTAVGKDDYDEVQKVVNEESERVLARSVESALNVKRSKILTDKMLFNFVNIGFIHMLFPNAKVVHTFKEDPIDAMFSLYKRQFDMNTAKWYVSNVSMAGTIHLQYTR